MAGEVASVVAVELPDSPDAPCDPTSAWEKGCRRQWLRRCWSPLLALLRRPRLLLVVGLVMLLSALGGVRVGRRFLALHHLKAGRDLLEHYHHAEARPHLETSLRLWPGNGETLLLLARAARQNDVFFLDAEEYLEQYQRLHGQTEEWTLERMLHAAAKGETDKVVEYCRRLLRESSPATPLICEAMIQGYFRAYRFSEVHAVLQFWLDRQPNNTQALLFQAILHTTLRNRREAANAYERILLLDPAHDVARLRLAELLMEEKKCPQALSQLQQLRRRQAENPMIAVLLARCLDQLGQQDDAEQLLEEILAHYPHFAPAVAERGQLALRQGQLDQAESWLREAIRQDTKNLQLHYHLVQCLYRQGKSAAAEDELRWLKQSEAKTQRLEIAKEKLLKRPQDPIRHQEMGEALLAVGQTEQGKYWLQRAVRENPVNVSARRALADCYRRIADPQTSESYRRLLPKTTRDAGKPVTPSGSPQSAASPLRGEAAP